MSLPMLRTSMWYGNCVESNHINSDPFGAEFSEDSHATRADMDMRCALRHAASLWRVGAAMMDSNFRPLESL